MSHLTHDELAELTAIFADSDNYPLLYCRIANSQFSLMRHTGGGSINGRSYLYMTLTDELIRDDALGALVKMRMARKQEALEALARNAEQLGLEY